MPEPISFVTASVVLVFLASCACIWYMTYRSSSRTNRLSLQQKKVQVWAKSAGYRLLSNIIVDPDVLPDQPNMRLGDVSQIVVEDGNRNIRTGFFIASASAGPRHWQVIWSDETSLHSVIPFTTNQMQKQSA